MGKEALFKKIFFLRELDDCIIKLKILFQAFKTQIKMGLWTEWVNLIFVYFD